MWRPVASTFEPLRRGGPSKGPAEVGPVPGTLLWSSFKGVPRSTFIGNCFVGSDYIADSNGADLYRRETGREIGPGEDGCYAVVQRSGRTATIGTDANGTHRLFYYIRGDQWCVSDSLVEMTRHLRSQGVELSVYEPHLAGYSLGITLGKQIASFRTVFEEVNLLPSWCAVRVGKSGATIVARPKPDPSPYRDVLLAFAEMWVSRFETLLASPELRVVPDLSGGADSRTLLALWLAASQRLGRSASELSFISSTGPRWDADFEVAQALSNHYGFRLNAVTRRTGPTMSAAESYDKWKRVCLGVYRPVYAPTHHASAWDVGIHGGGGENYRDFYRPGLHRQLTRGRNKAIPDTPAHRQWVSDVLEAVDAIQVHRASMEPMIGHYREFRGRIHSGWRPLYSPHAVPFVSSVLENFDLNGTGTTGAQINFDLMESLAPGLMDFPYDAEHKAPQVHHREALSRVNISRSASPGRVYVGPEQPNSNATDPFDRRAWLELLDSDLRTALRPEVQDIVGVEAVAKARAVMDHGLIHGQLPSATEGMWISSVLAADFALRSAS